MDIDVLNYGIAGVALILIIKEGFAYLKSRKEKNGSDLISQQLLDAITQQNTNHLHSIQGTIEGMCKDLNLGNDRVVKAITDMHTDLASRLGEIKGVLNNKK
jgi:hypothetical protein